MLRQKEALWRRENSVQQGLTAYLKLRKDIFNHLEDKICLKLLPRDITGLQILDFGCAGGYFSLLCAQKGGKIIGIDKSKQAVKIGKLLFNKSKKRGRFIQAETLRSVKKIKFDLIILKDILEHLDHETKILKECLNCLKTNGKILIVTPNSMSLNYLIQIKLYYQILLGQKDCLGWDPEHKRIYNYFNLKKILKENNLKIIKTQGMYLIPWGLIPKKLKGISLKKFTNIFFWLDKILSGLPLSYLFGWNMFFLCQKKS